MIEVSSPNEQGGVLLVDGGFRSFESQESHLELSPELAVLTVQRWIPKSRLNNFKKKEKKFS